RQPADRAPAEKPVDPLADQISEVLDFDCCRPFDAQDERGGFTVLAFGRARPVELDRFAARRDFGADNVFPSGHQLHRRETLPGEGAANQFAGDFAQRLGRPEGLAHGRSLMTCSGTCSWRDALPSLAPMTLAGKPRRKKPSGLSSPLPRSKWRGQPTPRAADLLAWYDRHRRALPWRGAGRENPPPFSPFVFSGMVPKKPGGARAPPFRRIFFPCAPPPAL